MQSKKGFTLVELIAVLAILAIILVLVVPAITSVGRNSRISLRDSKIQTIVTAGEQYGNDIINDYQECLGTTSEEELRQRCTVSVETLVKTGYIDPDDDSKLGILDPTNNNKFQGNILLCYDPANVNVYASYVEDDNYSCKDISINSSNTLALSSVGGVGYIGGKNIEVSIISSGVFSSIKCETTDANYATCSIEDNKLKMNVSDNHSLDFDGESYKEVSLTVLADYTDDDGVAQTLKKAYKLKVYPTKLAIVDNGQTCVPTGTSSQTLLDVLNVGMMSVSSSDKDILEGTAKDGVLYLSAKQKAGSATLTVREANGNNSASLTKKIYSLEVDDEFPENMVINHYQDVEIKYRGTGNVRIYSDNPGVVTFSAGSITNANELTLTDETVVRITASRMGVAKIIIEGSDCGREVRDISVSSLTIKGDTHGLVYVGGASQNVEIEVEEATNIECISSNPEAADCEIHATTVEVKPGSQPANSVLLTIGSQQVGYAYYRVQVLKTTIAVVDSSGRSVSTVCREKGTDYNDIQIFARGTNLGNTQISEIEDWYLAEATMAETGAQRNITVYPRLVESIDYPQYILGVNTGRTRVDLKEDNGNQMASFNYNIYSMNLSSTSSRLKVDETVDFEVDVSGTGEIYLTTSNDNVATAEIVESSTYDWTPNASNKRTIRVTAVGTGAATINVRGSDCGVKSFNVQVEGKTMSLRLVKGTYTTGLGAELLSCETEGKNRSCSVTFPAIYTSSEFQVVGYSKTKDSTTATYKVGDKITISLLNNGSTYYGNSMDTTKPVCSIPAGTGNWTLNTTEYLTMSCVDTGSGISGTGALSSSNFTVSNTAVGEIVSVGVPTAIANGYSYQIGIKVKQTGLFNLSLKANAVRDKFNNGNNATNLQSIFAAEYEVTDYYYIGKTSRSDVVAVLYDNSVLGTGVSGTYSLYIYGTGAMLDFMSSSYSNYAPWYNEYKNTITSIVIGSGVTNVGGKLAYNSSNLKSVTIPSGVTSIGESAFANTDLSVVNIPNTVTSIGASAFYGNKNLASLTLGTGVTSIGASAFYNHKINSLTIPSNVTSIGDSAFAVTLERAVLSSLEFQGTKLTTIGNSAFLYHKLTSLSIPSSVTSIGARAFEQTDISEATLKNLTFASNASLTTIGDDAFAYAALTSLSIPTSVTSIGARAFAGLRDGVSSIALGRNVRTLGNNFAYGKDLALFTVDEANSYFTAVDGILYNKTKSILVKCPDDYYVAHSTLDVPSTVRTIQAGAFDGWLNYGSDVEGLTVNLPANLTNMNIDTNFIFYATKAINISGNSSFDSINGVLFNKNRSIIYRLPLAFANTSYTIPNTVSTVADYFSYGNTAVETITVPSSVTKIGRYAFAADPNYGLRTINLNSGDTVTFDETSFMAMAYPEGANLASRSRTINVTTANLKSRIADTYSGVPYSIIVNKV